MNDAQLLRYSRHILLDEIGIEGQTRIIGAHALLIGAGGPSRWTGPPSAPPS
jgi:molybdopterin/thiamine biosynthesis adenylyltransferase